MMRVLPMRLRVPGLARVRAHLPGHASLPLHLHAQARRKKDRNAPKRPRNAYLVFLDRHRPALQAAQPHSAMKELTKEMAKEWQNVTPEERATCDAIAHQNKLAYEEAMRAYQQQQMAAAAAADGGASVRAPARAAYAPRSASLTGPVFPLAGHVSAQRDARG